MKKKILRFLLMTILFLGVSFGNEVKAADTTLTCDASDCLISGEEPIFAGGLLWWPGKSVDRSLEIVNNGEDGWEYRLEATGNSSDKLAEVMQFVIVRGSDKAVWSGDLTDFYQDEEIVLGKILSGTSEEFSLTARMSEDVGDGYQDLTSSFDLEIGYEVLADTSVSGDGGYGGGGGAVLGATACSAAKPDTPTLLSAQAVSDNSVRLEWSKVAEPVTYYLVAYGTESSSYKWGNPNIGDDKSSYVVSGLSGGQEYYFVVRAGNGCMPGEFSNELTANPGGEVLAGPAEGFEEGVLGEATESDQLSKGGQEEKTKGVASFRATNLLKRMPWKWILLGALLGFWIFWFWRKRRK